MNRLDVNEIRKIHDYDEDSDSDSGKSSFDSTYEHLKPPPVPFDEIKSKIVKVPKDYGNTKNIDCNRITNINIDKIIVKIPKDNGNSGKYNTMNIDKIISNSKQNRRMQANEFNKPGYYKHDLNNEPNVISKVPTISCNMASNNNNKIISGSKQNCGIKTNESIERGNHKYDLNSDSEVVQKVPTRNNTIIEHTPILEDIEDENNKCCSFSFSFCF